MEPFESDPEITRRTSKVLEVLRKKSRSESAAWSVLEVAAEAGRDTNQGRYIIEKARRLLLEEDGIKAECRDRGIGVYLMTDEEQVRDCAKQRIKRARGQVTRGIKEVGAVDNSKLSDHNKLVQVLGLRSLGDQKKSLSKTRRTLASETLPNRPME